MQKDVSFVIPTYRLRDVGETVERYDEHFARNGQSVRMFVFDDSTPATHARYYPLLEKTKTHNELLYVGPAEKEQFVAHLLRRLHDSRFEGLVQNLFRPSYGGNRNFTLMYTLGGLMGGTNNRIVLNGCLTASNDITIDPSGGDASTQIADQMAHNGSLVEAMRGRLPSGAATDVVGTGYRRDNIEDPFGQPLPAFERCYAQTAAAVDGLVARLHDAARRGASHRSNVSEPAGGAPAGTDP